ncbi:MAG TPA: TerC family protein [Burkholderiaceae bacterium]|nr:TerC family protein [Burkholderiaceae bacterium]
MMQWLLALQWEAIIQIIIIDILLGGDNAIIIALACRNLPKHLRRRGIIWGAAGAIILRVVLISIAVALLGIPWLKLVGAALLFWIGVKLMLPELDDDGTQAQVDASHRFWTAVRTIIVADFVMSLDNVIAIAAAAETADPSQRTGLIIFGLLFSVPFIIFGSQLVLKLLDRFPFIVTLGGALLGWIAGGLMVTDPALRAVWPMEPSLGYLASALGAVSVVSVAKVMGRSRRRAQLSAPHGT